MSLIRAVLDGLVPYEPGKPEEEVQRELGLERVVKRGARSRLPLRHSPPSLRSSTAIRTAAPTTSATPSPSGTASARSR